MPPKRIPWLGLLLLIAGSLGCNLLTPQPTAGPRLPATITPLFAGTPLVSPTATPGPTPVLPACAPAGWFAYVVAAGDTLYDLALTSGTTIDALVTANCLTDADQIVEGQVLALPIPLPSGAQPPGYYLIAPDDNGQSGPAVGCGDSAVFVTTGNPSSGDPATDLRFALGAMLAYRASASGSGLINAFEDSALTVQNVTVNGDYAEVALSGNLTLGGACAAPRIEAQILLTIFELPEIESALITVNGRNLKQALDASGLQGPTTYTRAGLP